jgi:hypothetical protein
MSSGAVLVCFRVFCVLVSSGVVLMGSGEFWWLLVGSGELWCSYGVFWWGACGFW